MAPAYENLPDLDGSPKQIAWASDIRAKAISHLLGFAKDEEGRKLIYAWAKENTASRYWIDKRENYLADFEFFVYTENFIAETKLPMLRGSPKQIVWANDIRAACIRRARARLVELRSVPEDHASYSDSIAEADDLQLLLSSDIARQTEAKYWIDLARESDIKRAEAWIRSISAQRITDTTPDSVAEKYTNEIASAVQDAVADAVEEKILPAGGIPPPNIEKVHDQILTEYASELARGGSYVADGNGGRKFVPWLANATDELTDALTKAAEESQTSYELESEIRRITGDTTRWAETVARTESAHVANRADIAKYAAEGLKFVRVWASKDERMCEICGKYHGKVYPIDAAPVLPLHPNCRCVYLPYDPAYDQK